jgi:phenylpropionate dioxygenase-like ring-hydroxylating dioxygenase large terminal subunit
MGADLARGCVSEGRVVCPLHGWEYGANGRCAKIPVTDEIPPFARQTAYPTVDVGGHVAFYNAAAAPFEFPFYEGVRSAELCPAAPFDLIGEIPWHMVGANAFDAQHFRFAHDRTLVDEPVVDSPSPFARRISATYDVSGDSFRDRVTRGLSGPRVRMTVTVWAGTLILVTAEFRRTTSYGMVFVRPLDNERSHLRTVVWVPRRRGAIGRSLLDPVDAAIRRRFIRAFMTDDAVRGAGSRYNPRTLIGADAVLRDYFDWLAGLPGAAVGSMKEPP